MTSEFLPVEAEYTNYRGECALRTFVPRVVWFGATEQHPERQWFVKVWDVDRNAERDYALSGFADFPVALTVTAS